MKVHVLRKLKSNSVSLELIAATAGMVQNVVSYGGTGVHQPALRNDAFLKGTFSAFDTFINSFLLPQPTKTRKKHLMVDEHAQNERNDLLSVVLLSFFSAVNIVLEGSAQLPPSQRSHASGVFRLLVPSLWSALEHAEGGVEEVGHTPRGFGGELFHLTPGVKAEWMLMFKSLHSVPQHLLKIDHTNNMKALLAKEMAQAASHHTDKKEEEDIWGVKQKVKGEDDNVDLVAWAEKEYLKILLEEDEGLVGLSQAKPK